MKGARLTPRDFNLLQKLHDYGILSSKQIAKWHFAETEKTTVLRRLRRLEEGEFIRKRGTTPDGTTVFTIGEKGARSIGQEPKPAHYPYHQLNHELTLSDVRNLLESLSVTKSWLSERAIRKELMRLQVVKRAEKFQVIIPDAIAVLSHFFEANAKVKIELELYLKSDSRYRARFKNFGPRLERPMHFYWYFVRSESVGRRIIRIASESSDDEASEYIGFTLIDELLNQGFDARLHMLNCSCFLGQVFGLKRDTQSKKPAEGDAQGQSREKEENETSLAS